MSLALYRKYRPATFAEVKGQEHVTDPLRQALRAGRVNHAYLFSGPRGCGKTSSARILARSLNCEEGPTPDPCGKCHSCIALAPTGPGHIDVIEIDAASHGGVDDARDLRERAFFAPVSARFKVYIIDEAHMVTREGFNALLKLVEEPPPHLKFVFATTEPEKVIGTIKSRTHHYPFRLMPPSTLRALLEETLAAEDVPYEPAALQLVVRAGAGSARDSLSILDQLLAGASSEGITYVRAVSLLGYTDAGLLDEVIDAFGAGDGALVFQAIDRVIEGGHDPRRFAADLLERLRDLVILSNVPDAAAKGLLDLPEDELDRMAAQASAMGPGELTRAAEVFNAGLTEMRGATSPRLLLELMCARVLLPAASSDESSLLARVERLERGAPAGPVHTPPHAAAPRQPAAATLLPSKPTTSSEPARSPAPATAPKPAQTPPPARPTRTASASGDRPTPPAPATPTPAPAALPSAGSADVSSVRQRWPQLVDAVKQRRRVAWMILQNDVQVVGVEGTTLTLSFARDGDMKGFATSGSDLVVAEVMKNMFGGEWRVVAIPGGSQGLDRGGSLGPRPSGGGSVPTRPPRPESLGSPASSSSGSSASSGSSGPPTPEANVAPPVVSSGARLNGAEDVDPVNDRTVDGHGVSGMELIQRELGGQIIGEIDHS